MMKVTIINFALFFATLFAFKKPELQEVQVYITAENTSFRLSRDSSLQIKDATNPVETANYVFVDPDRKFQRLLGIGGALTDASAEVFARLPADKQKELLKAYYDTKEGNGYTLARTNMNSCDFSSDMYTYVKDGDAELKSFNITHDLKYKIPLIKAASQAAGGNLKLFLTPWSPPAWMKDNNNMLHGGALLPKYKQAWANYYVRFIKSYRAEGVSIWGLTVQNEEMAAQRWESCQYTSEQEANFVGKYLGPTLAAQGLADKKIIIWDHNRDFMYPRAETVLNTPQAAKYVWGVGYHWYETWKGGDMLFKNEQLTAQTFLAKNLILTEACNDKFSADGLNDWKHGERYGYSIINDLNSGTVAWTDWNILLDEHGGPNHAQNFCFAPVHADTRTGALTYTNAYYYIGQFSRFIRPGATRVACTTTNDSLQSTAFVNADGKLVTVVMNQSAKNMPYQIVVKNKSVTVVARPHSISTFIMNRLPS